MTPWETQRRDTLMMGSSTGTFGLGPHRLSVALVDFIRSTRGVNAAVHEPDDATAQLTDLRLVVRREQDSSASRLQLVQPAETLLLKAQVADRQHLVDQ
jgi:hypothetical protein